MTTTNAIPAGVWVVIAAYNEGTSLTETLRGLVGVVPNIVVVDDGSDDDTSTHASAFPVWLLQHLVNRGQGAALQTGIDFALKNGATAIVTFDADNQHDRADIPAMLAPVLSGEADVTLGSRFKGHTVGIPFTRLIVLKLGIVFTRLVSRISVTDTHNGFRCFSREAAKTIRITQDRMAHASEILDEICQHKLCYVEVPVTIRYTAKSIAKGQSSWAAARIVWQFLLGRSIR